MSSDQEVVTIADILIRHIPGDQPERIDELIARVTGQPVARLA